MSAAAGARLLTVHLPDTAARAALVGLGFRIAALAANLAEQAQSGHPLDAEAQHELAALRLGVAGLQAALVPPRDGGHPDA